MTIEKVVSFSGGKGVGSVDPTSLVGLVMGHLVEDGIIEPFEPDYSIEESFKFLAAGEVPLGTMHENEKQIYMAAAYVEDVLDDFIRDRNAQIADTFAAKLRDKANTIEQVVKDTMDNSQFNLEDQQQITRLTHVFRMLTDLWSYSAKQRFHSWGMIGLRRHWMLVAYTPRK